MFIVINKSFKKKIQLTPYFTNDWTATFITNTGHHFYIPLIDTSITIHFQLN